MNMEAALTRISRLNCNKSSKIEGVAKSSNPMIERRPRSIYVLFFLAGTEDFLAFLAFRFLLVLLLQIKHRFLGLDFCPEFLFCWQI